jgi:LacI family transcriptional regulator
MVTGQGPVTITDVARLAGVSPGTASKALNGRRGISGGTALRVQQAAERLGYQPNALARGLLSGRSFTVGLITTDSFGRFSIPVVQGVEDALGPGRILVFLCESRDNRLREQHYLRAPASGGTEAARFMIVLKKVQSERGLSRQRAGV